MMKFDIVPMPSSRATPVLRRSAAALTFVILCELIVEN